MCESKGYTLVVQQMINDYVPLLLCIGMSWNNQNISRIYEKGSDFRVGLEENSDIPAIIKQWVTIKGK